MNRPRLEKDARPFFSVKVLMPPLTRFPGWPPRFVVVSPHPALGGALKTKKQLLSEARMASHRIFAMKFANVYPLYIQKAERKNRTREEVDRIICWLTGYDQSGLQEQIERGNDFEAFFAQAPALNPRRSLVKGVVCGVRIEEIEDPLMQNIRYLDKLVDELAKGKALEKILR